MTSTPSTIHTGSACPGGRFHISSDLRLALLFILPAVVLVAILMYYPMVRAVSESLYKTSKTLLARSQSRTDLCRPGTL